MFRSKIAVILFIGILVLSALGANSSARAAAPDTNLSVTVTAALPGFAASDAVLVDVTITNLGSRPARILKWFTPAEDVEEPLFAVSLNGSPVSYLGPIYKRPAATGSDYVSLKAGESLTRTVDLSAYYDFSASGDYSLQYSVASFYLHSENGKAFWKNPDQLVSEKINLAVEGRSAKAPADGLVPAAVTGSTTFNKCTTSQTTAAASARAQASTYAADALAYLNANKTGLRYTTWFGTVTSTRYSTAKSHFVNISSAMDTAPVTLDCGCKKNYYAYVYPTKPYVIYLCSVFWTAPLTGTDSKAGTLIHEMSHFNVVAGTNDFVYGQAGAKNLAITNPDNAVFNADNHEYFAENTPAQP